MSFEDILNYPWVDGFTLPERFNMVSLLLERHLEHGRGHRVAIFFGDHKITYQQLGDLTNRVGNGLAELGVEPGQRVILMLQDSPEFVATFLGAMKMGAVPVPINILATSNDLAYFINDSGATVVVIEKNLMYKLEPILDKCPQLRHVIVKGTTTGQHVSFREMTQAASPELSVYSTHLNDHSYWLYTSGTTGKPKGVIHLHKDLVYAVETWGFHVFGLQPVDIVVYCVSRLFFSYGLNNGLYFPLYYGGTMVLTEERPLPLTVLKIVERYRPTFFFSVPTSYGQILNYLEEKKIDADLSSVRYCFSAGEALPGPIFDRWMKRFNLEILNGLGSSEVGWIYICNQPGKVKKGSIGCLLPAYKTKVLDEDGNELPIGEEGDLWVSSQTLAAGYWNKPEKTRDIFRDGWMKTGDRVWMDEEGYYFYCGRSDDVFKVSGIWVSPLEVEEALLEHEAVAECGVVPDKDEMGLIKPKAFISLKSNFKPNAKLEAELKDYVKQKIAPYKYPRFIKFIPELPKTSTGKIQRYKLRQLESTW